MAGIKLIVMLTVFNAQFSKAMLCTFSLKMNACAMGIIVVTATCSGTLALKAEKSEHDIDRFHSLHSNIIKRQIQIRGPIKAELACKPAEGYFYEGQKLMCVPLGSGKLHFKMNGTLDDYYHTGFHLDDYTRMCHLGRPMCLPPLSLSQTSEDVRLLGARWDPSTRLYVHVRWWKRDRVRKRDGRQDEPILHSGRLWSENEHDGQRDRAGEDTYSDTQTVNCVFTLYNVLTTVSRSPYPLASWCEISEPVLTRILRQSDARYLHFLRIIWIHWFSGSQEDWLQLWCLASSC